MQSVADAFLNAPLLFLVPLLLLAFIIWAPWSPRNFYLHQHDWEHLEASPPAPAEERTTEGSMSDQRVDLGIEAPNNSQ